MRQSRRPKIPKKKARKTAFLDTLVENLLARNRGRSPSANAIKRLTYAEVDQLLPDAQLALAVKGGCNPSPAPATRRVAC